MSEIIGVLGVGNIGWSVCADLLFHGFTVLALDVDEAALQRASAEISRALRLAPMLKKSLPRVDVRETTRRLTCTTDQGVVGRASILIENVPERWETKRSVYERVAALAPPDALIVSNTSATSISRLGGLVPHPERFAGMHFMNPAHLTDLVEIVRGAQTSAATIERARGLATALGKETIVVEDAPGFASNRLSHMLINEAAWVVHDGVSSVEDVDRLFKRGFGHRMGPLETADLIGLDTVVATLDLLAGQTGDPKFRCCPLLRSMVEAGLFGRKNGRGFYTYPGA